MDARLAMFRAAGAAAAEGAKPFRPFFFLAALDAIVGVAVWLAGSVGIIPPNWAGVPAAVWHRDELLFGMVPAGLAGFLLTALPRWTGRKPVSPLQLRALVALWLAGRIGHAAIPAAGQALAALFIAVLALIVIYQVIAGGDRRNVKVGALLLVLSFAALAADQAFAASGRYGWRLGVAAIVALSIIIGGRVIPPVTAAALAEPAGSRRFGVTTAIEILAAAAAGVGLGAWVVGPRLEVTALACAAAAIAQTARLLQWRFWRVVTVPAMLVLHLGYAWIPAGFALAAACFFYRGHCDAEAVVHAWTVGVVGVMCLGVWASMIRRHSGAAFRYSTSASAAFASVLIAAFARVGAACFVRVPVSGLRLAAFAWIAAYLLFLLGFARPLLRGKAERE